MNSHYSASQINMYMRCSAAWSFRYVEGLKIPPASAMIQGTSYHKALETNFAQKIESKVDLPLAEVQDAYSTTFDEKIVEAEDITIDERGELKDEGVKIVKEYHLVKAPEVAPIAVEKPFKIAFDNVDYTLDGFIDVLGEGIIYENKTSAKTPNEVSADHLLQGTIYSMAEGIDEVEFDYAIKLKTPKLVSLKKKITQQDKDFVLKLIGNIDHGIKNEVFLPNRANNLCSRRHCGFYKNCEQKFHGRVKD